MLRIVSFSVRLSPRLGSRLARFESTKASPAAPPSPPTDQRGSTSPAQDLAPSSESPSNPPSQPSKKPRVKSPTDPAADYQRLLEERFGGGEAAALGQLVDGKPEGLGRHTKANMFRLI
ncbi:hypothetical protein JCM10212_002787 [Sporobolomyces blumeae]